MKQKIVVKVQMICEKCRTKALKIAAEEKGVSSVAIDGAEKDRVVVIGDEVDSVSLTKKLRKKLGNATIVTIQVFKPKDETKDQNVVVYSQGYYNQYCPPLPTNRYEVIYPDQGPNCSIM